MRAGKRGEINSGGGIFQRLLCVEEILVFDQELPLEVRKTRRRVP